MHRRSTVLRWAFAAFCLSSCSPVFSSLRLLLQSKGRLRVGTSCAPFVPLPYACGGGGCFDCV